MISSKYHESKLCNFIQVSRSMPKFLSRLNENSLRWVQRNFEKSQTLVKLNLSNNGDWIYWKRIKWRSTYKKLSNPSLSKN